jgi:hypothetical protein
LPETIAPVAGKSSKYLLHNFSVQNLILKKLAVPDEDSLNKQLFFLSAPLLRPSSF